MHQELYRRTDSYPISVQLVKLRWRFLGHVLRLPIETPANQAMIQYFKDETFEGEPRYLSSTANLTTIPRLLELDVDGLSPEARNELLGIPGLTILENLEVLRTLAQGREHWREVVAEMEAVAHARWFLRDDERIAKKITAEARRLC